MSGTKTGDMPAPVDAGGFRHVAIADLGKIRDVLAIAVKHHIARDEANAHVHLGQTRFSPLTSELVSALERIERLIAWEKV